MKLGFRMASRSARPRPRKAVRQARQARSKNTVEAIIEAATRILANDGWDALNTNAIARIAGVSIGSVYEYFPNKEAIVDVIIDRHLSSGEARLAEVAANAPDELPLEKVVKLLVRGFVDIHCDDPKLHRALSGEVPLSSIQRARVDGIRNQTIQLVKGLMEGSIENTDLKATIMIDAADALTHRWFVDEIGIPASPDVMSQELKRMLRSYLTQSN
ncbi:TetR/AcrR family transcriptional regulator [Altererythrobacter sp. BO-6]|uniref:TetR/AcrR family transcriptional regulator n=1 Tax=Altererythrobacter sp. BO-6 TaxID=2604537 RepID=UPI0013E1D489|nr:TetR/AcrR family transcriptional regulator [Altererythrobacter sp. BO-6]QIG55051.1 TetR/AcrR family transcriptional regulator [Altererythrobacter sp. BO-6]